MTSNTFKFSSNCELRINFFLFVIFSLLGKQFFSQSLNKKTEAKIQAVETNLPPFYFKIEGKPSITIYDRMVSYNIPGLSVAVIHNYKIEWLKTYGWADTSEKRPVTPETMFQAASVSKSVNGVALLKLAQEKKMDLNGDINLYLKKWQFPYDTVSRGRKITTMNLLSHTAGLPVGGEDYESDQKIPTLEEIFEGKKNSRSEPLHSEAVPGLKFKYSNNGPAVSQLIVRDVSGKSYENYMAENILKPLDMNNSTFSQPPPKSIQKRLATGYLEDGKEVPGKYHIVPQQASGGLWTTPEDLCKFLIETMLSYEGKSEKVLNQKMTKKQVTSYLDFPSALGVFRGQLGTTKFITHSGALWGFRCKYVALLEKGVGLVVMANSENADVLIDDIILSVAKVYDWNFFPADRKTVSRSIIDLPESDLDKYNGIYRSGFNIVSINKKDGALWYKYNKQPAWKVYFSSDSDFFSIESRSYKCFTYDKTGKINGFKKKHDEITEIAQKVELLNLPDAELKKFTGKYMDEDLEVSIVLKENKLWLQWAQGNQQIFFLNKTEFFMDEERGTIYNFTFDSKGNVTGYVGRNPREEKVARKL